MVAGADTRRRHGKRTVADAVGVAPEVGRVRVYVVGGIASDAGAEENRSDVMDRMMRGLGRQLATARFPLVACSPYEGSVDLAVLQGWSEMASHDPGRGDPRVEMHCPDDPVVVRAVAGVRDTLGLADLQIFRHPPSRRPDGSLDRTYSWLLAQLNAMDRCDAIVALGGSPTGSARLLLQLASTRRVPVIPLGHLGGAAAEHLERHRYELRDMLGSGFDELSGPREPTSYRVLLEGLVDRASIGGHRDEDRNFFISYARERPAEADLVEMTLRRRNRAVYRDEHAFEPGSGLLAAIAEGIHAVDVFLALWCREYACSPWCNDELEAALDRAAHGALRVVILDLDGTRIVPRRARGLIAHPSRSRPEIEALLLRLVEARPPRS